MLACLLKIWTGWCVLGRGGTCASEEPCQWGYLHSDVADEASV